MILLPIFSASIKNPKLFLLLLLTLKPIPLNLKFHPFLLDNHISDFFLEFLLFLFKLFDLHLQSSDTFDVLLNEQVLALFLPFAVPPDHFHLSLQSG